MCIKWILDKMGQFRTYNDINLSNRLVRAQQNLTELNAAQKYFMNSVKGFEVARLPRTAFKAASYGGTVYGYGIRCFLTFTGNKENKNVVFFPNFEIFDSNGNKLSPIFDAQTNFLEVRRYETQNTDKPNTVECFFDLFYASAHRGVIYVDFFGVSNDVGKLSNEILSTYDPDE